MRNRFKIEFRHKQLYLNNDLSQPVVVQCNPNGTATYIPGTVPGIDWVDMTDHTQGLENITLSWSAVNESTSDTTTDTSQVGSNYQKGVSDELTFAGNAFNYIFDWLMTDVCQLLNSIEVRIYDFECGKYLRIFELKLDNINYKPEDRCILTMPLREADATIQAAEKTIIEDDWQKWFNSDGTSAKDHPTFQMIVEKKPKFFLAVYVVLIYVVGMLSGGALIALNEGKRWIKRCLGFTYFCPSPLIRTHIENFCSKFGFTFDTIFDDLPGNRYRDACFFCPASSSYQNFDDYDSPSTKYIWDNRSVLSIASYLNQLKLLFNCQWYITPNKKLVFKPKSFFDNQPPLYDFTAQGADPLWHLEYTFNGNKKPAYGQYSYMIDPQDTCSNEVKWRYNAIVDYDGPLNNPMLEGKVDKPFQFAATAFHNDGATEEFLEEGVKLGRLIAAGALLIGLGELFTASNFITVAIVVGLLVIGYAITNDYVNNYFNNPDLNGMVRVSNSEINIPRIILWDRNTPLNRAKTVSVEDPAINPRYNTSGNDYYTEHPTFEQHGYFGGTVRKIYNYPMFVDELFLGNLYDEFHDYDNPLQNPTINQTFTGEVDLCCSWLDRLGLWEGDYVKIGFVLIIEDRKGRKIRGRIENVDADYKIGKIKIKGTVLK